MTELIFIWVYFRTPYSGPLTCVSPFNNIILIPIRNQIRSVAQLCLTLCDPMNHSTPGLPVHHQLLEFTETHIHQVSDAIQPSHPLSCPSPPAPNPSIILLQIHILIFNSYSSNFFEIVYLFLDLVFCIFINVSESRKLKTVLRK